MRFHYDIVYWLVKIPSLCLNLVDRRVRYPAMRHSLPIDKILAILRKASHFWTSTTIAQIARETDNPFKILVATVLSARTKDVTTLEASKRLFKVAPTPQAMMKLPCPAIEKSIFPVGFYRTKAKNVRALCRTLVEKFGGKVPETVETLVTLSGVGRKTANLVVTMAFQKHGICVDTHVHRISNRWGLVKTKNPKETELALYKVLQKKYWIGYNDLLVSFGQNICQPVSPFCSRCPVEKLCPQINVSRHR